MELWIYGIAAFFLIFVFGLLYITCCWIGACATCQIHKYIPDLTGNHPNRLNVTSVREPFYTVSGKEKRGRPERRHVSTSTCSLVEGSTSAPAPAAGRPLPSINSVSETNSCDKVSVYGKSEIDETFLCKVDVENQRAIYTVVNDSSSDAESDIQPSQSRSKRINNYSSFVTF